MTLSRGTTRTVKGHSVILTGETTTGKSGETFYAVQIVTYPFKALGKPQARYGKPQWVRESLLK